MTIIKNPVIPGMAPDPSIICGMSVIISQLQPSIGHLRFNFRIKGSCELATCWLCSEQ